MAIYNVSLCDGCEVSNAPGVVPGELHKHELGSGRILETKFATAVSCRILSAE